jgi:hypothetical protein
VARIALEVQHAQKSTELTGDVGRVRILEMGHSFFQRSGALGKHLLTEDGDLGCLEDALGRVDDYPVLLELGENSP